MDIETQEKAKEILIRIIKKLPTKLQFNYILVNNTQELIEQAAKLSGESVFNLKMELFRKINTKKYKKDRAKITNGKIKDGPRHTIFGIATEPIVLNIGESSSIKSFVFTYLHEVGHLAGLKTRLFDCFDEIIADRIALHYFKKLYIKRDEE